MTRNNCLNFEIFVMDIAEEEKCTTAKEFERLAQQLHESIEAALEDMCMDLGILNYEPLF